MNNFNKNLFSQITMLVVFIVAVLFLTVPLALAQSGSRVYLQPVESAAGTLTVDVIAENVTDMYGAEFRLKYDPAVVSVQDVKTDQDGIQIQPGTLLPADQGFVVANQVNEAEGSVTFAMTLLNPAPAVSGSGPLARVTFNVLQASPSTINVEHAKLVAVNLQTIPSETTALAIGDNNQGQITSASGTTTAPPAATDSAFPWWVVALIVLIVGLLGIGAVVMKGGLHKIQPPVKNTAPIVKKESVTPPTKSQQPATEPAMHRPSAFKEQPTTSADLAQKPRQFRQ